MSTCAETPLLAARRICRTEAPLSTMQRMRHIETSPSTMQQAFCIETPLSTMQRMRHIETSPPTMQQSFCIETPLPIVQRMCDRSEPAISQITCKVLEPSCGNGIFLAEILRRRLMMAHSAQDILVAVSNLYGIDILPTKVAATRNLLEQILRQHISDQLEPDRASQQRISNRSELDQVSAQRAGSQLELEQHLQPCRALDYRFWPLCTQFLQHNILQGDFLQPSAQIKFVAWVPVQEYHFVAQPVTLAELLGNSRRNV